ncbi:TPA: DUF262 domain-containing protein [Photobacterium damselae]
MNFTDVLSDIEKLVGKQLQSVNPKTPPIYLTAIDYSSSRYYISSNKDEIGNARSFTELETIWSDLIFKGFCSVDQALFGGGSSRNQPETIFAHLPYIQHFRFKGKKHLFLRGVNIHNLGTLSELVGDDLTLVLSKIDNYFSLSHLDIYNKETAILAKISTLFNKVSKGTIDPNIKKELKIVLDDLNFLDKKLNNAIVTINDELKNLVHDDIIEIERTSILSVEEYIEDEKFTGIENENIDLDKDDPKVDIRQKSDNGSLRIRYATPVLALIFDRISFDEIELQPDFQRQDRIWKDDKKSKLIESILMGLPLPAFYFAEKEDGDWIVVDGLQRITTIYDFMKDDFHLKNIEALDESYNGKYFSGLSRLDKRKIREYQITAHVIDADSDKENLIVELFHRINTYGVQLSNQEIRSAMYQGSSVTFLRYLSSSNAFLSATNKKVSPQRQKDMELCLSALAYIILGYKNFDYKTYDTFLCVAMKKLNHYTLNLESQDSIDQGKSRILNSSSEKYIDIENMFTQGLKLADEVFGDNAFKKNLDIRSPISKPLFEVIVATFANVKNIDIDTIIIHSDKIKNELYSAIENDSTDFSKWNSQVYSDNKRGFAYSISSSTGKKVTIEYRFNAFRKILKKATGINVDIVPIIGE